MDDSRRYRDSDGWLSRLPNASDAWAQIDAAVRLEWQAKVYEAILNACLAVPAFSGVIFWEMTDESSFFAAGTGALNKWPHTPPYPDPESSQPCLFGRDLAASGDRLMYFPKPAYYGVRSAMTNYFGRAFSVKDAAGQELVRFVENGNVLLMKSGAS
jgi:hypothetical protein